MAGISNLSSSSWARTKDPLINSQSTYIIENSLIFLILIY